MNIRPLRSRIFPLAPLVEQPWLGHFLFLVSGLLALWFYKERMCILDGAVYSFELTSTEDFFTPHHRTANWLFQALPLLAVKLGMGLRGVLMLYSLSFVLVYYLVFLFCRSICRRPEVGWAILLIQLLLLNRTYFWPVSEVFHCMIFGIGFYAWASGAQERAYGLYVPVAAFLFLLGLATHPVAPAIFAFGALLIWVEKGQWIYWKGWALCAALALVYGAWKVWGPQPSEYEQELLDSQKGFGYLLAHLNEIPGYIQMKVILNRELKVIPVFGIATLLGLLFQKKWLKGAFLLLFSLAYFLLVVRTYQRGESSLILSNVLGPLGLFALILFLRDVLPSISLTLLHYVGLIFLFFFFQHNIRSRFEPNRLQLRWHENMAALSSQLEQPKLIVDKANLSTHLFYIDWSIGVESLLLSSLDGPENTSQVFATDNTALFRDMDQPETQFAFATFWPHRSLADLNPNYFQFPANAFFVLNDSSRYTCQEAGMENAALEWEEMDFKKGKEARLPVKVTNQASVGFSSQSAQCGIGFTYYFEGSENFPAPWTNFIPLETDLPPGIHYEQILLLYAPPEKGSYTLHIGLRRRDQATPFVQSNQEIEVD